VVVVLGRVLDPSLLTLLSEDLVKGLRVCRGEKRGDASALRGVALGPSISRTHSYDPDSTPKKNICVLFFSPRFSFFKRS
jgi:hypothetical protein